MKAAVKLNSARQRPAAVQPLDVDFEEVQRLVQASSCCLATAPQIVAAMGRMQAAGFACTPALEQTGMLLLQCQAQVSCLDPGHHACGHAFCTLAPYELAGCLAGHAGAAPVLAEQTRRSSSI